MTGVVIQNTATDAGGNPLKGAFVRITLVASASGNAPGLTNGTSLGPPATVKTDSTGHWSIALTPNTALTPTGTWYIVDEGGYRSTIVVPPSGGPYNLEQVVTTVAAPPGTPSPSVADVAAAEAAAIATSEAYTDTSFLGAFHVSSTQTWSSLSTYPGGLANDSDVVHLAGGTMTGPLVLPGNPTSALQAAPKQYVDNAQSAAQGYVDGVVATEAAVRAAADTSEASARLAGDAASVATAEAYADAGLATKAADSTVVHLAGTETVTGAKTFSVAPVLPAGSYGTPGSSGVGDGAAAGTAATLAHSDHTHGREGFGAVTAETSYGLASSAGTATTVPHSDHTHGTPSLTLATPAAETVGASGAVGTATTPARADHVHAMPGAATAGASAVGDTATQGSAVTVALSDHRHGREAFGGATAQTTYGAAAADGIAVTVSHSDHAHGTPALPTASAIGADPAGSAAALALVFGA